MSFPNLEQFSLLTSEKMELRIASRKNGPKTFLKSSITQPFIDGFCEIGTLMYYEHGTAYWIPRPTDGTGRAALSGNATLIASI